jgi:hypothetical protein
MKLKLFQGPMNARLLGGALLAIGLLAASPASAQSAALRGSHPKLCRPARSNAS